MDVTLSPAPLTGTIRAIASKSCAHRLLICAALADRPSRILCAETNRDIEATVRCLNGLGAEITPIDGGYQVRPLNPAAPKMGQVLDCGESGSTLRFLLPVICALGSESAMMAHGRLPQRPLSPLYEELTDKGAVLAPQGSNPLQCGGQLRPGTFTLAGHVSSQYISGLLFALPLLSGDSVLHITGHLESRPYVDMTLDALRRSGITVTESGEDFFIPGNQTYRPPECSDVEGDWSNAAFWLCAGALAGPITVTNLNLTSPQGDRAVLNLLRQFGAAVETGPDWATVSRGTLRGMEIDSADTPDLVPVLSIVAALAEGTTVFRNAGRLRIKECDRLTAMREVITALGGSAEETETELIVHGVPELSGGTVDSRNDHRIAMSAAVAAIASRAPVTVTDAGAVSKSYPRFFEDYRRLGGIVREVTP